MAGVLTEDRAGTAVREVAGALIGMRRSLVHNAPGGSGSVQLFRTLGLGLAAATLLCGLIRWCPGSSGPTCVAARSPGCWSWARPRWR